MFHTAEDLENLTNIDLLIGQIYTRILNRAHEYCHKKGISACCNCHSVTRALLRFRPIRHLKLVEGYVTGVSLKEDGTPKKAEALPYSWFETEYGGKPSAIIDVYPNGIVSSSVLVLPKKGVYAMFGANFYTGGVDISDETDTDKVREATERLLQIFKQTL